ncbi:hypothetical protein NQ315_002877 [Exocentrus adspersus]|uniref:Uncharacterized protein n=1 Tax=Exocentrus adspersus TaxID=1586481 RepID=A0AAV8VFL4_9CUCU|nr:hypothetical protein NQ315_002877 [Exocentrus adspersus]
MIAEMLIIGLKYKFKDEPLEVLVVCDYDVRHTYNVPLLNKAVLGVFKDENAGNVMPEFVGLRAKLYDFVVGEDYGVVKKAKGKVHLSRQNLFKSIKHVIHTQQINKTALSPFDDKRYILPDGISTLAWGNHCIP